MFSAIKESVTSCLITTDWNQLNVQVDSYKSVRVVKSWLHVGRHSLITLWFISMLKWTMAPCLPWINPLARHMTLRRLYRFMELVQVNTSDQFKASLWICPGGQLAVIWMLFSLYQWQEVHCHWCLHPSNNAIHLDFAHRTAIKGLVLCGN